MSTKRGGRSRRLVLALGIASVMLIPAGPAVAQVHGITPLRCVGVELDGAEATDTTPAASANGGPIDGLIPSKSGVVGFGDGGFDTPACPVPD